MSSSDREIEPLSDSDILDVQSSPDVEGFDLDYDNVGSTMVVEAEELESDVLELDYDEDAPTRAAMEPPPRPSLYGSFVAMESEQTPAYLVVDEVLATLGSKVRSPLPPAARPSSSVPLPSVASEPELPVSVETPRVGVPVAAVSSTHAVGDETTPVSVYESIAPVALSESLVPPSAISSSYPANQNSTWLWAATFAALGTAAAALVILLLSHDGASAARTLPVQAPQANANAGSPFVTPAELPAAQPNVLSFPESEAVMIAAETRVTASVSAPAEVAPAASVVSPAPAAAPAPPSASTLSVSTQVIGKPSAPPARLDPTLTLSGSPSAAPPSPAPAAAPKRAKTPMEILADEQLRR